MADPTTRPGETARHAELAKNDPYRMEVLALLAVVEDRTKQTLNWQSGSDEWRANHDRNDAASFAEIRNDVASLKRSVSKVTSSVGIEQLNSRYTLKDMVIGCIAFAGALGAFIAFVGWYLQGKP